VWFHPNKAETGNKKLETGSPSFRFPVSFNAPQPVILSAAERSEESRSGLFRRPTAGRDASPASQGQNDRTGARGVYASVFAHIFGFDQHFLNSRNSSFWGPKNAKSCMFNRSFGSFRQNSIFLRFRIDFSAPAFQF
jgi:hypothetical protein